MHSGRTYKGGDSKCVHSAVNFINRGLPSLVAVAAVDHLFAIILCLIEVLQA